MVKEKERIEDLFKVKRDISRLRSEVRKNQLTAQTIPKNSMSPFMGTYIEKLTNPFTGAVSGNYWTQTGMPWV